MGAENAMEVRLNKVKRKSDPVRKTVRIRANRADVFFDFSMVRLLIYTEVSRFFIPLS
jgi:hypothetical protein